MHLAVSASYCSADVYCLAEGGLVLITELMPACPSVGLCMASRAEQRTGLGYVLCTTVLDVLLVCCVVSA